MVAVAVVVTVAVTAGIFIAVLVNDSPTCKARRRGLLGQFGGLGAPCTKGRRVRSAWAR